MRKSRQKQYITYSLRQEDAVYISAAAGRHLSGNVDLYEKPGVLALVGRPTGRYRLGDKPGTTAKLLYARGIQEYMHARFPRGGGRLGIWYDPDHEALLCGNASQEGARFGEAFTPVTLADTLKSFQFARDQERLCVPIYAPACFSVGVAEDMVCFVACGDGGYKKKRNGSKAYVDAVALAEYIALRFGRQKVCYRVMEDGLVFSARGADLLALEAGAVEGFRPLELREPSLLVLQRDRRLWLSPQAAVVLKGALSIYACNSCLALRPEARGDVRVQRVKGSSYLFSIKLYQQILMYYPGVDTLYLIPQGGLLILSETEQPRKDPPPGTYFCRLLMESPSYPTHTSARGQ